MDASKITVDDVVLHVSVRSKGAYHREDLPEGEIPTRVLNSKAQLEPIVDADLAQFSKFYAQELANNDISKFELAAIKTYLAWKLRIPQRA